MARRCFVVMPIRTPGTVDHQHFRAIYNEMIKRTIEDLGFECMRADEVSEGGSINNDIIIRIAESELLIADLTDLNPNVFYEIRIRHTLRSRGTILLIDESRTDKIPFDLSSYRTIKYTGSIIGAGSLREDLRKFVSAITSRKDNYRDSPVHDALPTLPPNVFEEARNSSDGRLRVELADAKQEIANLKKSLNGGLIEVTLPIPNPRDKLEYFLAQAIEDKLPQQIMDSCNRAAREYDIREFIAHATQLCAAEYGHEVRIFVSVAGLASQLGLDYIGVAIYDYAISVFPTDPSLLENRASFLLTSSEAEVRERARKELQLRWKVSIGSDGSYAFGEPLKSSDVFLATRYYDSLKADNLIMESFSYAKSLVDMSIDPRVLRTFGVALIDLERRDDAYAYYKASVVTGTPSSIPLTLRFWAIDLVNTGELREAIQIQARGCMSDLDESMGFGWLVSACNRLRKHGSIKYGQSFDRLQQDDIIALVNCALSCSSVSSTAVHYIADAFGVNPSQVYNLRTQILSIEERRIQIEAMKSIFGDDYFDRIVAAPVGEQAGKNDGQQLTPDAGI